MAPTASDRSSVSLLPALVFRRPNSNEAGIIPATGAVGPLISSASGVRPYFVGKPNPLMMRSALNAMDAHSEDSVMIGDNMDIDVIMGIESGMEKILVLSGVTGEKDVARYSYGPLRITESVAQILT